MLYDQLIEIARDKQQRRRRTSVHKGVPCPILLLVVGDGLAPRLDQLYQQVSSRWSSSLTGLQVCYCGCRPYAGSAPVLQMRFSGQPAAEQKEPRPSVQSDFIQQLEACGQKAGPACAPNQKTAAEPAADQGPLPQDALRQSPALLRQFNQMIAQAVAAMSRTPRLAMNRAYIHVILQPQSPLAPLVTDMIAVAQGHLESYGAMAIDCRLYLMLPDRIATEGEKNSIRAFLEQLPVLDGQPYDRPVLQLQQNGPFESYKTGRLVQSTMLLDEWNELVQRYDLHGERLQLLGDLIEMPEWISGCFLQTVGVQETHAGPEYWLAAAANQLCELARQELQGSAGLELAELQQAIEKLSAKQLEGMERAFENCCLYLPFQPAQLQRCDVEQAERMIFGRGMEETYRQWLESRRFRQLPDELDKMLQEVCSIEALDQLSHELDGWANQLEKQPTAWQVSADRVPSGNVATMDAAAQLVRRFIVQRKYMALREQDCRQLEMEAARLCAEACRRRAARLERQQQIVEEITQELQPVWYQLRDAFNDGSQLQVQWLGQMPGPGFLRQKVAEAGEDMEACTKNFLEAVADRVDLNGREVTSTGEPPMCCRFTIVMSKQPTRRNITEGISAGRTLCFVALSNDHFAESDAGKSFLLNQARS